MDEVSSVHSHFVVIAASTVADPNKITYFASTNSRGKSVPFGIKRKDRARHMYVIGKTGMGKSTLLENMAIQDIRNGEGIAFIDPHGSTADRIMEYVPEHRIKDVVYFAPFDMEYPIAFNVMEDVGYDKRHLVVSGFSPPSARFGLMHGAPAWSTFSQTRS
jgi:DNA helicase HerA-like ATPase